MQIVSTQVLKGPNYWSNFRRKLIVMKLDLQKYEYLPTNTIENFNAKLKLLLPSLYNHYCSPGCPGGLFARMEEGTWLGHVIEHVALELQSLAGMDCGFGRTYSTDDIGVYHVIFSYQTEKAGLYAAHSAVDLVFTLAQGKEFTRLEDVLSELKTLGKEDGISDFLLEIIKQADVNQIPYFYEPTLPWLTLGYGKNQKRIWGSFTSKTSTLGIDLAEEKLAKEVLAEHLIPILSDAEDPLANHFLILLINFKLVSVVQRNHNGSFNTVEPQSIHPITIHLAERIAHILNLDICEIELSITDLASSFMVNNGKVRNVNAKPDLAFYFHFSSPSIPQHILSMLYPNGQSSARIPIVAVTGTNGKTTVVRLIAEQAIRAKKFVGFTTTDGIYLNKTLVDHGDCSGPHSAQFILKSPEVDFAVLECARGGILRSGLGFDQSDISILTNITSDHLGLNDIHYLDEMARVKGVVLHSTKKDGYAILNAEDDLVYAFKEELVCNIALFSTRENPRIIEHCSVGGLAAYVEQECIVIRRGVERTVVCRIRDVPITFQGKAPCMIANLLPAILVGYLSNFSLGVIREAIHHFIPNHENLPGRMNIFEFSNCKVMIDYAHNEAAFIELRNYLNNITCSRKVGIITAVGDRRDEDIEQIGFQTALLFDEIIIRHDRDCRGRTYEEISQLLINGIERTSAPPPVTVISDESEAVKFAIKHAIPNTFILYAVEDVFAAIEFIKGEQRRTEVQYEVAYGS